MDHFSLETTVHRIGGQEHGPRSWGPWVHTMNPNGDTYESINALGTDAHWVRVQWSRWTLVRSGLLSAQMRLEDINGYPLGTPRAVLVSTLPCDVPLYSNHIPHDPSYGVFSVGLRIPRSVWTAEDVEPQGEAE